MTRRMLWGVLALGFASGYAFMRWAFPEMWGS